MNTQIIVYKFVFAAKRFTITRNFKIVYTGFRDYNSSNRDIDFCFNSSTIAIYGFIAL